MDFKDYKLKKDMLNNIRNANSIAVHSEASFNNELRKMDHAKNFNKDAYVKGEEWYQSGLNLQDAPEELKKNIDFVRGFERGKRLATIADLEKKNNISR